MKTVKTVCSNSCDGGTEAVWSSNAVTNWHRLQGNKQLIVLPLMLNTQKRTKDLHQLFCRVYEVSPHSPNLEVTEFFKFFQNLFEYIKGYCNFHFRFDQFKQTVYFKKKNKTRHLLVTLALRAQTRNLWSPNCLCLKNVVTCGTDHLPMWSRWSDPKCVIGSLRTGVNIRSGRDHTVSSYVHASCLHCQNLNTDRSGGRKSENTEGGNHETPLQSY